MDFNVSLDDTQTLSLSFGGDADTGLTAEMVSTDIIDVKLGTEESVSASLSTEEDIEIAFGDSSEEVGTDMGATEPVAVGNSDHNNLRNRDAENAHPISSITRLQAALDATPSETLTNEDIEDLLNSFV